MKKLFALMVALTMVFAMASAVSAEAFVDYGMTAQEWRDYCWKETYKNVYEELGREMEEDEDTIYWELEFDYETGILRVYWEYKYFHNENMTHTIERVVQFDKNMDTVMEYEDMDVVDGIGITLVYAAEYVFPNGYTGFRKGV